MKSRCGKMSSKSIPNDEKHTNNVYPEMDLGLIITTIQKKMQAEVEKVKKI